MRLHIVTDRTSELPVRAGHERAARRHRLRVFEHRVAQVGLTAFGFLVRNRPLDIGRQTKRRHLRLLPVLLEPAAVVAVHR